MVYNITNITDANDFGEILIATNSLTGELYMMLVMLSLFLIGFMVFKEHKKIVFIGVSFMTAVVGSLLFFGEYASWRAVVIPIILLFASIIYYVVSE